MKKLLLLLAAATFFALSLFLTFAIAYLVRSEVVPALLEGTLAVQTNTMVLNRVWEGNEIYLLLGAYALVACVFAYAGVRLAAAVRRARRP